MSAFYQVTARELLLDFRSLGSLSCGEISHCAVKAQLDTGRGVCDSLPAPGGPIKIILTLESAAGFGPCAILSSSSFTRCSSLETRSCSPWTVESPIGAILQEILDMQPDQGEFE